jgi:hypothetical protein
LHIEATEATPKKGMLHRNSLLWQDFSCRCPVLHQKPSAVAAGDTIRSEMRLALRFVAVQ